MVVVVVAVVVVSGGVGGESILQPFVGVMPKRNAFAFVHALCGRLSSDNWCPLGYRPVGDE